MSKVLHVVSLDVPSPPSYGGVIDIYYRLKTLTELGAKIHLHCFQYGRKPITNPSPLCEQIYYYPRRTGLCSALTRKPYITYSRRSSELLQNLLAIDAPILFEGIHCCQYLNHHKGSKRERNWFVVIILSIPTTIIFLKRLRNQLKKYTLPLRVCVFGGLNLSLGMPLPFWQSLPRSVNAFRNATPKWRLFGFQLNGLDFLGGLHASAPFFLF